MKTPKQIFNELVEKAKVWTGFKGYSPGRKLNSYQLEQNASHVGDLITRLPEEDRKVLTYLSAEDFKNDRVEDAYFRPAPPKRQRRAALRLVVNNNKK